MKNHHKARKREAKQGVTVKDLVRYSKYAEKYILYPIFGCYLCPQSFNEWMQDNVKKHCCQKCQRKIFGGAK